MLLRYAHRYAADSSFTQQGVNAAAPVAKNKLGQSRLNSAYDAKPQHFEVSRRRKLMAFYQSAIANGKT
ncbi:hypothetical protein TNCV_336721 [Trichonephila clavipes]|nr:hypothetical protein TNCV_336721 [Trichonephila clavipes]